MMELVPASALSKVCDAVIRIESAIVADSSSLKELILSLSISRLQVDYSMNCLELCHSTPMLFVSGMRLVSDTFFFFVLHINTQCQLLKLLISNRRRCL